MELNVHMATKEEIARYAWVRSGVLGALGIVLGIVMMQNRATPGVGLLIGVLGVGLLIYALVKRDRDARH